MQERPVLAGVNDREIVRTPQGDVVFLGLRLQVLEALGLQFERARQTLPIIVLHVHAIVALEVRGDAQLVGHLRVLVLVDGGQSAALVADLPEVVGLGNRRDFSQCDDIGLECRVQHRIRHMQRPLCE